MEAMPPSNVGAISSPARIELEEMIGLKRAGESFDLTTIRARAISSGGHLSPFKGRGVEFDEARPYEPGDDLRTIDWRVTARTGKPYTKVFREERDRPVIVWADMREPMLFATQGVYKAVQVARTAALIAWSTVAHSDRFGGLIFSETEHVELRPRLGRRAALHLLKVLSQEKIWSRGQSQDAKLQHAEHALARLMRVARPGSLIFLLSDFRDLSLKFETQLRQLARHCDLFLVHFFDPVEKDLPPPGRYRVKLGTRTMAIDTDSPLIRRGYRKQFEQRQKKLRDIARSVGIHFLECSTADDPRELLAGWFENR